MFSPVMQGSARMMAPPTHGQPSLVSSSTTQYPEQTHTMYGTCAANARGVIFNAFHLLTLTAVSVSPGPMPQQYPHPSATLHPHPQHPQPSATPTGQAQQGGPQHGGPPSHPAASPVQHPQHPQAAAGQCPKVGGSNYRAFNPSHMKLNFFKWSIMVMYTCVSDFCCSSSSSGPGPPPG